MTSLTFQFGVPSGFNKTLLKITFTKDTPPEQFAVECFSV